MGLHNRGSLEPWLKDEVDFLPHQVEGIRKLAYLPDSLNADDMGLGKSLEALAVFSIDVIMGYASSCLIVCPPTLITNWTREIEKFTRFPYMILDGPAQKRNEIIIEFSGIKGPKILITNYEKIHRHVRHLNALSFNVGIFDEAHYIKGPDSKRTKACHELRNGRTLLLTGTPMLNHVSDLWGLFRKLDPTTENYNSFVNKYARYGGYGGKSIVGIKNEKELRDRLNRVMLRRRKEDVLDLEKPTIIPRIVDLHPIQQEIYDKIKKDFEVIRPDEMEDEKIEWSIVQHTRMRQAASTTLSFNGEDISPKLDLVMQDDAELLENGERIVVFTQFREVQQCYIARHKKLYGSGDNNEKLKYPIFQLNGDIPNQLRQTVVDQWASAPTPGVIVCMLQVAGIGLNMVAGSEAAFIDKLFVPKLNQQAIDRLARIGQTKPVRVREYRARKTVEDRVVVINKQKDDLFGQLIEGSPEWQKAIMQLLIEEQEADAA